MEGWRQGEVLRVTLRFHMSFMTHPYVYHDSFVWHTTHSWGVGSFGLLPLFCVIWFIVLSDVIHCSVWYDSLFCVIWFIVLCDMIPDRKMADRIMRMSHGVIECWQEPPILLICERVMMWYGSFHSSSMTHSYVHHDTWKRVTWPTTH